MALARHTISSDLMHMHELKLRNEKLLNMIYSPSSKLKIIIKSFESLCCSAWRCVATCAVLATAKHFYSSYANPGVQNFCPAKWQTNTLKKCCGKCFRVRNFEVNKQQRGRQMNEDEDLPSLVEMREQANETTEKAKMLKKTMMRLTTTMD